MSTRSFPQLCKKMLSLSLAIIMTAALAFGNGVYFARVSGDDYLGILTASAGNRTSNRSTIKKALSVTGGKPDLTANTGR